MSTLLWVVSQRKPSFQSAPSSPTPSIDRQALWGSHRHPCPSELSSRICRSVCDGYSRRNLMFRAKSVLRLRSRLSSIPELSKGSFPPISGIQVWLSASAPPPSPYLPLPCEGLGPWCGGVYQPSIPLHTENGECGFHGVKEGKQRFKSNCSHRVRHTQLLSS